ncbi:MAG: hypothetical protein R3D44_00880 [Hyphomicrobiaceae bacterium]
MASDPGGFAIDVEQLSDGVVIGFDQWVEEFGDFDLVRDLFCAALAGSLRVRVDVRAGRRWRWTLERREFGCGWVSYGSCSVHRPWKRGWSDTLVLRNNFQL